MRPDLYGYSLVGPCHLPMKAISKSNEKTQGHYLSGRFRDFENIVATLSRAAYGPKGYKEAWVVIELYFKNKSHIDLNNSCKSIFDGLVKGGVLSDDKYVAVTVLPAVYGKVEKVELTLWSK